MPQRSTAARAQVRRRDGHKVVATAGPRQPEEGEEDEVVPAPSASTKSGMSSGTSARAVLSRDQSEGGDANALHSGDRVDVLVDDPKGSHATAAAGGGGGAGGRGGRGGRGGGRERGGGRGSAVVAGCNIGGVGPGAEPPVAVAAHAFAREEPHPEVFLSDHSPHMNHRTEETSLDSSLPGDHGLGAVSTEENSGTCGSYARSGVSEPGPRHRNSGKDDCAGSPLESTNTNNEEEAATLPDSFNLSDEYGPEGASTGRNHHDDDDFGDSHIRKSGDSVVFGLSPGSSSRRTTRRDQPAVERYVRTRHSDDDSWSRCESRQEINQTASASASDNSDWASSPTEGRRRTHAKMPQPQRVLIGRRTKRISRIVPSVIDAGETSAVDSEGTRRRRRASRRNASRYRSPPSRWQPRGAEENNHQSHRRRGVGRHQSRDRRRISLTETESMSGEANYRVEEEITRLRRENESLKQHRERQTRHVELVQSVVMFSVSLVRLSRPQP